MAITVQRHDYNANTEICGVTITDNDTVILDRVGIHANSHSNGSINITNLRQSVSEQVRMHREYANNASVLSVDTGE